MKTAEPAVGALDAGPPVPLRGGPALHGPSAELRRFSAGMRLVVAMLCTLLLLRRGEPLNGPAAMLMLAYGLWAGHVLWKEATGRPLNAALRHHWVDLAWAALSLQLNPSAADMFVLALVHPVALASIGYGVRAGLQLALVGALAVVVDFSDPLLQQAGAVGRALPALGVLALVPAAALLSRPMSVLRQRLALVGDIEQHLDPRRGLEAVAARLVDQLRKGTGAQLVGLVLPSADGAPATLATSDDGSFRTSADVHRRLEALLADTPDCAITHVRRRRWRLARGTRLHGCGALPARVPAHMPAHLPERMDALAALLDVRTLVVMPLRRYQRRHGHLLMGLASAGDRQLDVAALEQAAPELLRIVEQAKLVDQLQDESASHERARIGRDLHDSAIQPYLGLKYAVECVALRIPRSNPARAEVDALAELVNGEVAALRELISGLRTGGGAGDNALVPAVRRQVRRFTLLFGIDVEVDCPDTLVTTRAVADALFHMVNEALNNVRRHSGARRVWIALSIEAGTFRLRVRDDAGSLQGRPAAPFHPKSLGERAAELGGSLQVSHPDGLNTEILVLIPL